MSQYMRAPAYGYVRLDEIDHDGAERLQNEIADCCTHEGIRLVGTFCDLGDDGSTVVRLALSELLTALKAMPNVSLVMPDITHLSRSESIRAVLLRWLRRSEHRVLVVHYSNGSPDKLGFGRYAVWLDDEEPEGD